MTALPPQKPSPLPCSLQTNTSSPEKLRGASSSQELPSSNQVFSFSWDTKQLSPPSDRLAGRQQASQGCVWFQLSGEQPCPLTAPGSVPRLQLNPPVFIRLLWGPPPICERRWEDKGQNHTVSDPATTQLQTPARGQTSGAMRPGRARASDLRPINTRMTRKKVLRPSLGVRNGVDAWAVSGQLERIWEAERQEGEE